MTIAKKFLLSLCLMLVATSVVTSLIGIYFLHQAYTVFTQATKPELIPIMADRMFLKAILSFGVLALVTLGISLPLGVYLMRQVSQPYLQVFKNLTAIAHQRIEISEDKDIGTSELVILKRYLNLLFTDLKKLKDYEKEKEWKSGARMLMHEIKNPMTPLKLSVQNLIVRLQGDTASAEDARRIETAVYDMEKILSCFKELVNIEFGPKEIVDIKAYADMLHAECAQNGNNFKQQVQVVSNAFLVLCEKSLFKMLYVNLVFNGLQANSQAFNIQIRETASALHIDFVTPERTIKDPSKLFKIGYSTKGSQRGLGLFLCKKISDYLDAGLVCRQENGNVVFSVFLQKAELVDPC